MFEFPREVVNRDGYKFIASLENGKYVYKTSNKDEIRILEKNGFKNTKKIKDNKNKDESNK